MFNVKLTADNEPQSENSGLRNYYFLEAMRTRSFFNCYIDQLGVLIGAEPKIEQFSVNVGSSDSNLFAAFSSSLQKQYTNIANILPL